MSIKYCLVKYLYWEVAQRDNRKNKHLDCKDCPLRDNCKYLKEDENNKEEDIIGT